MANKIEIETGTDALEIGHLIGRIYLKMKFMMEMKMKDVEVYIGDMNDPDFKWGGGDWNGNSLKRISEFFPSPLKLFDEIINQLNGKQVDWGCWVVPLYPNEIVDFISNHYENDLTNRNQVQSLRRYIMNLNPNEQYALAACEIS
jgi:hypothetical protein